MNVVPLTDLPALESRIDELKIGADTCGKKMFTIYEDMSTQNVMPQTRKKLFVQELLLREELGEGKLNMSRRSNNLHVLFIEDKKHTELR